MTISRKALCVVYALTGLVALAGTWGNITGYLDQGFVAANVRFWQDTLANPATRFITVDLLFLGLAAIVWMLLEARRLSMRWVWLYVLVGLVVAISVAFPAFLIHRERALAARDGSTSAGALSVADILLLVALVAAILAYTFVALGKTYA